MQEKSPPDYPLDANQLEDYSYKIGEEYKVATIRFGAGDYVFSSFPLENKNLNDPELSKQDFVWDCFYSIFSGIWDEKTGLFGYAKKRKLSQQCGSIDLFDQREKIVIKDAEGVREENGKITVFLFVNDMLNPLYNGEFRGGCQPL
ncbi:MAG: hypothetical protein NTW04_05940 [Elusimicrobia bacterium]|nr:hypothetical protein [Elusimicrobiota bacterium]